MDYEDNLIEGLGRIERLGQITVTPVAVHALNVPVAGVISAAAFMGMDANIPGFWKAMLGAGGVIAGLHGLASLVNLVARLGGAEKDPLPTLEIR